MFDVQANRASETLKLSNFSRGSAHMKYIITNKKRKGEDNSKTDYRKPLQYHDYEYNY